MSGDKKSPGRIWILILLLVMILGAIIWLRENRDAFKNVNPASVDDPEVIKSVQNNNTKLLVIGIDALTWSIINDLIGQNKLPHFQKLILQGSRGILNSEKPMISPALWTTFATGVPREKHRIDNFVFKPVKSYQTEIMDSRIREAPALWEILSHYGKKVAVINWNSASPAEPINGVFIADGARKDNLSAENVYPAEWIDQLKSLPVLRVEWFEELLQKWNHPMPEKGYQEDIFVAAAAIEILNKEQPDLMMIYFRNLDMVSHLFWKYRWPVGTDYQFQVSQEDQERFGNVIERYYEFMDELIGKIIEASPGYTVMIFSDHGQSVSKPPENIFVDLNLLLHRLGFLEYNFSRCEEVLEKMKAEGWYQSPDPAKELFFDCETLRRERISDQESLAAFLAKKHGATPEKLREASGLIDELHLSLSHPELSKEINWQRTRAFNLDDFHKNIRGIYLNLKERDPEGVVEFKDYSRTRQEAIKILSSLQNEKGEKFFKMVKAHPEKKEPLAKGIIDPPDLLVEFNPGVLGGQYISRKTGDSNPFFISMLLWSYQDVSGDHSPEGVIIISGKDAVSGRQISATVYDPAPTILRLFAAPIGKDQPGKILESAFKFPAKKIKYVESYAGGVKIPVSWRPKQMSREEQERMKAVGYIK